jgi:hypothetical protein
MQITSSAYQNRKLPAWLICAGLIIGLFIFTGYSSKSIAGFQQPVQTTRQYNSKYKTATRNISYKKASADFYKINRNNNSSSYAIAILTFNKRMQVKLIEVFNKFIAARPVHTFIQKTIPQSSEEYPRISVTG